MMFKTPFESVLSPVVFEEVEEASERKSTEEHRIFPVSQRALLESGGDNQTTDSPAVAKYTGDKWGGKYLRAPDIYWTILEKGKDKLVRLGDVAEVRRGFTTGANEFFYLNADAIRQWEIEEELLKPVIKSPRECKSILIDPSQLKFKLFMCGKDREDLDGTAALEYIEWGESQEFDQRPSCSGRTRWWEIKETNWATHLWVKSINDRHMQARIPFHAFVDQRLYVMSYAQSENLNVVLNCTPTLLFKELHGRVNLGEGALDTAVYEANQILIINPEAISVIDAKKIEKTLSLRDILPIFDEVYQPDRRALDAIIFDALDLTQGERDGVYEAVVRLVEARLNKAKSLKG